jgi:hypothetical protein
VISGSWPGFPPLASITAGMTFSVKNRSDASSVSQISMIRKPLPVHPAAWAMKPDASSAIGAIFAETWS